MRNIKFDDIVHRVGTLNAKTGWTWCGEGFVHRPGHRTFADTPTGMRVDDAATCLWCIAEKRR